MHITITFFHSFMFIGPRAALAVNSALVAGQRVMVVG